MDWFPLTNSLRIAVISTIITFFLGIFLAYYIAKAPRFIKGLLDTILTLPLVLPPTVVGFFLLKTIGPNGPVGSVILEQFDMKIIMTWYASIFATTIVTFPLLYRTVRAAFEAVDTNLIDSGKTLGLSNTYIFWRVLLPNSKQGIIAGMVLAFARALGEYGATSMVSGYIPRKTATISTTVYQLWRESNDALAYRWVLVNLAISFIVLVAMNYFEKRYKNPSSRAEDLGLARQGLSS